MDKGKGFLILYLTPSKAASAFVPGSLQIVDVLPNYTLGGFFGSIYRTDSEATSGSLVEFYAIPALARWKGRKCFYLIAHDPATKPDLIWRNERNFISLCSREGSPPYISMKIMPIAAELPFRFHLPFIEIKGEGVIFPKSIPVSRVSVSSSSIYIPPSSPLSIFPFRIKVFTITFNLAQVILEEQKLIKGKIFKELKTGVCGRII